MKGEKLIFMAMLTSFMSLANIDNEHPPHEEFNYFSEQFADLRILRYKVEGFENLSLQQKKLAYFLAQAGMAGRDIIWDQHYKHNLVLRRTFEAIYNNYKDQENPEFKKFHIYLKRIWFSNGIHHHYSKDKFVPDFSKEFFKNALFAVALKDLPLGEQESIDDFHQKLETIIFDPLVAPKKVSQDRTKDLITHSAVNFYENITQAQVEAYYKSLKSPDETRPLSHGLNAKLVFENGTIVPKTYRLNGMYHKAIEQIIYWLNKASEIAESSLQQQSLQKLVEFYETGDLAKFDEYSVLWVKDTQPMVDAINGFIEVYSDPMNKTASYESVVSIKDQAATDTFGVLAREASWFEKNSPILPEHKRESVTGISYKIINVVMESGDSSPSTPVGINLPNANWIREQEGSKAVSLGNIQSAYEESSKTSGLLKEFYLPDVHEIIKKHGALGSKLHTGLHEVIGHASGRLEENVGDIADTLQNYGAPIEEARADLVALYFIGNQHLVDLGLIPSVEVRNAEYISYLTNGLLTQMARIDLGNKLEQAHMRNRQMISKWVLEKGASEKVVELKNIETQDGPKTYVVINDYDRLNELFGELLKEVQRIKSQGDFKEAQDLIETYGVWLDSILHEQVLERYKSLAIAPYAGFINPHLQVQHDDTGEISDIIVTYPDNFTEQMLGYAKDYSFLPNYN